ncbi:MAG: SagB/ThcOx family dehydrogenase [Candidatus Sumerlaeota bacterium]|nr:SagB/ThcOx family dehydrogenase [Candidatus Sumerlaeota bacterium]
MDAIEAGRRFLEAGPWGNWQGLERDQQRGIPAPPVEKPWPAEAKLVDLVAPEAFRSGTMPLREAIAKRRSRRKFTTAPLTLEELSFLLWATQGVKEVAPGRAAKKGAAPSAGVALRRTVPSGGARHAFETYLAIQRVEGLAPGLYRYLSVEHQLCLLREDAGIARKAAEACCKQSFIGEAAVVFLWTAIPYRMEWRYGVLSPKVIAVDAGHVCQNLYLASEAIGAGACAIGAYLQGEVDALLGVDGKEELTVYIAPVGKVKEE